MRLAIFNDSRLGVVSGDSASITDVTEALTGYHDGDPFGAGWWLRLCRDYEDVRPRIHAVLDRATPLPLSHVQLQPPVLNPGKIVAVSANYAAHIDEMQLVRARVGHQLGPDGFDVFLKATSSIVGPGASIVVPENVVAMGEEVHHESELVVVVGRHASNVSAHDALSHVFGYSIGLDITLRSEGDRSRRKSYDSFSPIGPWITTADEVGDPQCLQIRLLVAGEVRQDTNTSDMLVSVSRVIEYASSVMQLEPGDLIFTGAPPGVGAIHPGETICTSISGIGAMENPVKLGTS